MEILFIIPYPENQAPSQRFRFEQYFHLLKVKGIKITILQLHNQSNWKSLYAKGHFLQKILLVLKAFLVRFLSLFRILKGDFVFIHREAFPVGPPLIEWIIAKDLRKKIIYDFDDALWLTDKVSESKLRRMIRLRSKVQFICKWSYKISCGNEYLCQYSRQFNKNVILNPTTIDTEFLHNRNYYVVNKDHSRVVIGWTGSHSTLKYLSLLENVLKQIQVEYDQVDLLVIADKFPETELDRVIFRPWSTQTEIIDLLEIDIDIGIMPLPNDEWTKGKCGFKALQYMALEIPPVISPVGVNTEIVKNGTNGFLCNTDDDWLKILGTLIHNHTLRRKIGSAGRRTVIERYSVSSNSANFLSLFDLK